MLRQDRMGMPTGKAFVTDDDNYVGDGTTMLRGYEIPFVGCMPLPAGWAQEQNGQG